MWSKGWPNSKTKMSKLAPSLDYVTNGTTEFLVFFELFAEFRNQLVALKLSLWRVRENEYTRTELDTFDIHVVAGVVST